MPSTKVLVVDDSAAMRALFCDILDNATGVTVCGVAANADEARARIAELKPDVLTLDVEMPGKSGMDFLAELMAERPMPVIMLSSLTQAGTGAAKRALELGAVHCFPKRLHSSREEFDATVAKLGGIVLKAARGELAPGGEDQSDGPAREYEPGDKVIAIALGKAGLEPAKQLLASYPANCPPTVLVVDAEADHVERAI
ncbi:MAG: response regulator, partial [Erythrobacter sp.]